MRQYRVLCILLFLFFVTKGWLSNREPDVITKWGWITGKWSNSSRGRQIANFLGIPYAKPPLADLRFKSPQKWNHVWNETRPAVEYKNACSQLNKEQDEYIINGSEDCLYLNVFVPNFADHFEKVPVLVYVHGGGYMAGSSHDYAPDYLLDQDIILVTLNYRLNVLGFFSTTNQASPGNYGLKDIRMALKWIQENIHSFNGDAKSVTLMGSSAGASATHLLALSNKTEGLFNKYIIHGGNAVATWSVHVSKLYRQICLQLARMLGCLSNDTEVMDKTNNPKEVENNQTTDIYESIFSMNDINSLEDDETMITCMRKLDVNTILKEIQHFYIWRGNPMCIFGPVIEKDSAEAIVTMNPLKIVKNGFFRDIPAIIQVVKDEGLVKTLEFFVDSETRNEITENFDRYLLYMTEYHERITNTTIFADIIREFYFNGNETYDYNHIITAMTGDAIIFWPTLQVVRYYSEIGKSNIYFSSFEYEGTFSFSFYKGTRTKYGVNHGDDLNYLFPILNHKFDKFLLHNTEADQTMINIMTELWTSFVKKGVPEAWAVPKWPVYRNNHQFMRFGNGESTNITIQDEFLHDRMEFWEKLTTKLEMDENIDRTTTINNISTNEYTLLTYLTVLFTVSLVTLSIYLL